MLIQEKSAQCMATTNLPHTQLVPPTKQSFNLQVIVANPLVPPTMQLVAIQFTYLCKEPKSFNGYCQFFVLCLWIINYLTKPHHKLLIDLHISTPIS